MLATAMLKARILGAVLILAILSAAAFAAALPALTSRVVDDAALIDAAAETALTGKLAAFEAKSSDQIVVATIDSLGGEPIEQYANTLFRNWGLGQAGENNGVLLLVAKSDRKMRIEVGYGLEGTLTDLHTRLIIENTMVPAFRAGDFSGGISKAVDDIMTVLEGNGGELEKRLERNPVEQDDDRFPVEIVIFVVVWGAILFGGFLLSYLASVYGRKLGAGRYRWLGMTFGRSGLQGGSGGSGWTTGGSSWSSGGSSSGGGWSSGGSSGGFSGGGGSSGGGGASGSW